MSSKPQGLTVAIAGATGRVGQPIAKAFLADRTNYSKVIVLTRDPTSETSKALEKLGATLVKAQGPLEADKIKGADILVSALHGAGIPEEESDSLFKAAAEAGVKVYFPSEYGANVDGLPGGHAYYHEKRRHREAAKAYAPDRLKVIAVYVGLFSDPMVFVDSGALLGFDYPKGRFSSLGSSTNKWSWTSCPDVGKAVARLSVLAIAEPKAVPNDVYLSGDERSTKDVAEIYGRVNGVEVTVAEESTAEYEKNLNPDSSHWMDFVQYVRYTNASGAGDYSKKSHNGLVNPGLWKWTTVEDVITELKGKL